MTGAKFTIEQRRQRLARRHLLSPDHGGTSVAGVAGALAGLHATDPTTVYVSVWARLPGVTHSDIEAALYDERSVVRVLGMRRTMFVVPLEMAPILDLSCARDLAERERRRTEKMLSDAAVVDNPADWLNRITEATYRALQQRGAATASELTADVPELATTIPIGQGTKWAGEIGVSTRVLFLLATQGRIVRGRPRGTWLSSQYRWTTMESWVDLGPYALDPEPASTALMERYLRAFGPATDTDISWWTGWTKKKSRTVVERLGAVTVSLDDGPGFVLGDDVDDDLEQVDEGPWVEFLPSLDPTVMGWKDRSWYLPDEHAGILFDRNGNAGHTVWVSGKAVGGWGQTKEGEVVFRLLEDIGAEGSAAVAARGAELSDWLDGTVVRSRFPSPLQRQLTAAREP